jgi:hypothetical protein
MRSHRIRLDFNIKTGKHTHQTTQAPSMSQDYIVRFVHVSILERKQKKKNKKTKTYIYLI